MGRPKAFDPDLALERAIEVFWEHGFEGTAMSDLVGAMEIARQSLYDTFGDKRELFQRAVEHYCARRHEQFQAQLASAASPLAGLREFIASMSEPTRGCLLVNTLAEFGQRDAPLATFLREQIDSLEQALIGVLQAAQRAGELPPDQDLPLLAATLANGMHGLALLHRIGAPRAKLELVVSGVQELLNAPGGSE